MSPYGFLARLGKNLIFGFTGTSSLENRRPASPVYVSGVYGIKGPELSSTTEGLMLGCKPLSSKSEGLMLGFKLPLVGGSLLPWSGLSACPATGP